MRFALALALAAPLRSLLDLLFPSQRRSTICLLAFSRVFFKIAKSRLLCIVYWLLTLRIVKKLKIDNAFFYVNRFSSSYEVPFLNL